MLKLSDSIPGVEVGVEYLHDVNLALAGLEHLHLGVEDGDAVQDVELLLLRHQVRLVQDHHVGELNLSNNTSI